MIGAMETEPITGWQAAIVIALSVGSLLYVFGYVGYTFWRGWRRARTVKRNSNQTKKTAV